MTAATSATGGPFNDLIISDLHLREADRDPAGRIFYFDQEFADFLRYYRLFYVGDRRWRLIIDGDFVEFFRIRARPEPGERLLNPVTLSPTDHNFFPGTESSAPSSFGRSRAS